MKLGEFFIDLIVDAGEGKLTLGELVKSMGELEAATVGQLGVLFALGVKLADMTEASMHSATAMRLLSRETGISSQELQKYEGIAKMSGMGAGVMLKNISGITAAIAEMKLNRGGKLMELSTLLGINLKDMSAVQILESLRSGVASSKFKALSAPIQTQVLGDVGIDPSTELYFDLTNKKFAEFNSHVAIMSKKQEMNLVTLSEKMQILAEEALKIQNLVASWDAPKLILALENALRLINLVKDSLSFVHNLREEGVGIGNRLTPGLGSALSSSADYLLSPLSFLSDVMTQDRALLARTHMSINRPASPSDWAISKLVSMDFDKEKAQPIHLTANLHVPGEPPRSIQGTVDAASGNERKKANDALGAPR